MPRSLPRDSRRARCLSTLLITLDAPFGLVAISRIKGRVALPARRSIPEETVADHLIAGVIEQFGAAQIEERLSRAQAYAGLLYELLLDDDAAPMSHVYLIQDVHAAVTAVMDRLRPSARIADSIAEPPRPPVEGRRAAA